MHRLRNPQFASYFPTPANMQFMPAFGATIPMPMAVLPTFLFALVLYDALIRAESRSPTGQGLLALNADWNLLTCLSIHFETPARAKSSAMYCKLAKKNDLCSVFHKCASKLLKINLQQPLYFRHMAQICSKKAKFGRNSVSSLLHAGSLTFCGSWSALSVGLTHLFETKIL